MVVVIIIVSMWLASKNRVPLFGKMSCQYAG